MSHRARTTHSTKRIPNTVRSKPRRAVAIGGAVIVLAGLWVIAPDARQGHDATFSRSSTMTVPRRPSTARHESQVTGSTKRSEEAPPPDCPMAAQALGRLETRLREELEKDPLYAKYLDCVARNPAEGACGVQLADALYSASSRALDPFVALEAERLKAWAGANTSAMRDYLRFRAASTRDPIAAMSAVNLLLLASPEGAFPLPEKAYAEISKRTAPEVQMILNGHGTEPFPTQEIRDEILGMATDPKADPRLRVFAMGTLGKRADDAPILGGIVDWAATGDPGAALLSDGPLPRALARCGSACDGILEQLAADSSSVHARQIVSRTLAAMDESQRDALFEHLRAAGIPLPPLPQTAAQ
jgi:hypothetical protein